MVLCWMTPSFRLHRRRARLPARRAHLIRVVLHVLDRLQSAERLVHGAAEGKVVDGAVLDDALLVNDEEAAERDALVAEHLELLADLLLEIGDERVPKIAKAALLAVRLHPREVRELAVHRNAGHLAAKFGELVVAIRERRDLRRADEREVEGVEEHD